MADKFYLIPPALRTAAAFAELARGTIAFQNVESLLVLDLDGDGVEVTKLGFGVNASLTYFDMDNDTFAERTAWVAGGDGFLAIDRNGNGKIDNQSELFGNTVSHTDGFANLRSYDSNQDGKITAKDAAFAKLRVWVDADGDAITDKGELKTLAKLDITQIDLHTTTYSNKFVSENPVSAGSTFVMNGVPRAVQDVWFRFDTMDTRASGAPAGPSRPPITLKGFGELHDLHLAMASDATLNAHVNDLVKNWSLAQFIKGSRATVVGDILFRWAGVDNVELDSRGPGIDARVVGFVEKLTGQTFTEQNLDFWAKRFQVEIAFDHALDIFASQLFVQAAGSSIFASRPVYNLLTGQFDGGTVDKASLAAVAAQVNASPADRTALWSNTVYLLLNAKDPAAYSPAEVQAINQALQQSGTNYFSWEDIVLRASYALKWGSSTEIEKIQGTAFADYLVSSGLMGILRGEDGDDVLFGGGGDDQLLGGSGDDWLAGGAADDSLDGGSGNDTFYYESGYDVLTDGGGFDAIVIADKAITAKDVVLVRAPNGGADVDVYLRGTPAFTLKGQFGANRFESLTLGNGTSIDLTKATYVQARTSGTSGANYVQAPLNSPRDPLFKVNGGDGDDVIQGSATPDWLLGGAGNDRIFAGRGYDTLIYPNRLEGEAGDDVLIGGREADWLLGGAGSDTLHGGGGTDRLSGGDDNDQLLGGSGPDFITGGEGDDLIDGDAGQNGPPWGFGSKSGIITGGTDLHYYDDRIFGDAGNDRIYASVGDDEVEGGTGSDVIDGGDGNDTIQGGEDNDQILGGLGNDQIAGGVGNDTYRYREGDGADIIVEVGGTDTLEIAGAFTAADLSFAAHMKNDDLYGLDVFLEGQLIATVSDHYLNVNNHLEAITLDNDTSVSLLAYKAILGSSGSNTLIGMDNAQAGKTDAIFGLEDNDTINGKLGNDFLIGGNGNDTYIYAATGNGYDIVYDESGVDKISVGASFTAANITLVRSGEFDLLIRSGAKNLMLIRDQFTQGHSIEGIAFTGGSIDLMTYSHTLTGTAAGNILAGTGFGAGGDIIYGLGGNDSIMGLAGNDKLYGGAGNDIVDGGLGDDTFYYESGRDVFIDAGGKDNVVIMDNKILAKDVSVVVRTPVSSIYRTTDADVYIKGVLAFTLNGQFTQDTGFETITLASGGKIDLAKIRYTLNGTTGNDVLDGISYGGNTNDVINGLAGNDTLNGGLGNDTLDGGLGRDILQGGAGDDIYKIALNSGVDTITDQAGKDTILFGAGFTAADMTMVRSVDNINILFGGVLAATINNHYVGTASIEFLRFADNTVIDLSATTNTVTGTNNVDMLKGTDGIDVMNALNGNDTLYGYGGNDTLDGGNGADRLYGGLGDDIYVFASGFGSTTFGPRDDVQENLNEGNDLINFLTLKSTDVYSSTTATGLLMIESKLDAKEALSIRGILVNGGMDVGSRVEKITFADGATWDLTRCLTLNDGNVASFLYGSAQNDIINGGGGNDTIRGVGGADKLTGGLGSDTFVFEKAHAFTGIDTVTDFSKAEGDKLKFSGMLEGYSGVQSTIANFIQIITAGSDSVVKVDVNGAVGSANFVQVATLTGVTGMTDELALLRSGTLIV